MIPLIACFWSFFSFAPAANDYDNNIPPRFQWNENSGYCGEVSFISAGLYYGQYLSQYDARAVATRNALQYKGQLLLGVNDVYTAARMHLNATPYSGQTTDQFLAWVKQHVVAKHPVAIGIFTNEYLFYGNTDPNAGDAEYDHIVPVYGISSTHPLTDPAYYDDDNLFFSDNGLWGNPSNPPYLFHYAFNDFQATRQQANAESGPVYSLRNDGVNYGIAITGIMDLNGDTVPVQLSTDLNYEKPEIANDSNTRPTPMPLTLTIAISNLEPNILYTLYRYNKLASVPNSQFNANASNAYEKWPIQISSGSTFVMTDKIQSNETAVYRCVKATAP